MGRKVKYEDGDLFCVTGAEAATRLKLTSDRRALIDKIINLGGRAMLEEINTVMGFDARDIINSLVKDGWLDPISPWNGKHPPLPKRWPGELS